MCRHSAPEVHRGLLDSREERERERDADEIEICIRRGAADSADRISRPTAAYVDNKLGKSSIVTTLHLIEV